MFRNLYRLVRSFDDEKRNPTISVAVSRLHGINLHNLLTMTRIVKKFIRKAEYIILNFSTLKLI